MHPGTRVKPGPGASPKRRSISLLIALLGSLVPVTIGVVTGSVVAHASGSSGTVPIPTSSNVVTEGSSTAPATGTNQWIFLPDPSLGTVPTLLSSGDMQMTNTGGNEDGYAYWNQPLTPAFLTASFDLSMGGGSGADGMSFSLANASSPGRGSYTCCGADLGFGGGTGLGVDFDTYQNTSCDDPSSNYVGVAEYSSTNTYGCTHIAVANPLPVSLRQYPGSVLAQVLVSWVPSPSVTVWLNGTEVLNSSVPSLPSSVLVGFGGGTGGLDDYHQVSNIQIGYSQQQAPTGGAVAYTELFGAYNCSCNNASNAQNQQGEPIDTAYGNYSETQTDLSIPGRGIPLEFTRTYNAQAAAAGTTGPLGYGWASNYSMSLSQPGGSGPVTITQEGGATVVFDQSGTTYTPAAPRDIATLSETGGVWTFGREGQDTYTFNSSGQLTSEIDLHGYPTTLTYSGGKLSTITDKAGRTLSVGWTGSDITSVTDANVSPNSFGHLRIQRWQWQSHRCYRCRWGALALRLRHQPPFDQRLRSGLLRRRELLQFGQRHGQRIRQLQPSYVSARRYGSNHDLLVHGYTRLRERGNDYYHGRKRQRDV